MWDKVQALVEHNTFDETKIKLKDKYAILSNLRCDVCGEPYIRTKYSSKIYSLSDTKEECFFSYPVLKCSRNHSNRAMQKKLRSGEKRCKSEYLHECGIIQSFMEKLYLIKDDIKTNDDDAEIIKEYYDLCMNRAEETKSILYRDYTEVLNQIETVKASIKELAENQKGLAAVIGEVGMFRSIINDYENELKELEKHKEDLITKIILADPCVKQFEYFVDSIIALPEISSEKNYLIPFNKNMYLTFIDKGVVHGDVIEYKTKFGISFRTTGNTRKMVDFIGYRTIDKNGNSIIIQDEYEISGKKLQYRKKKTG